MGAQAPAARGVRALVVSLLLASASAQVEVASDKTGTHPLDVVGLQRLFTAWGQPTALKNWMSPDPCAISNPNMPQAVPAAGIICDTLDQPVKSANGADAWLYVKEIRLSSRNPLNFDFNLAGEIAPAAFANGRLGRLEIFDVSFNKISGSIPAEVAYLTNLTRLALNNNQINSSIPSELGLLTNLDILWLGRNHLTGSIPGSLEALAPKLKSIKLERNNLAQIIPTFLATATNLVEINLAFNRFTGRLPAQYSALTDLTSLYLHSNALTGGIPASYSNMRSLRVLMLSGNQLSGPIPTSLATIPQLQNLGLANNHLTGIVPPELAQLPNLGILSLQWNNFTGTVGPVFQRYPQGFLFNPTLCVDLDGSGYQTCACTMGKEGQQICYETGPPGACVCPDGTLPEEQSGGLAVGWIVMITLLGAVALAGLAGLLWWGYRAGFGRRKAGGWEYAGKIRSFPDVRTYRSQAYDPDEIDGYGITAYDPTPATAHSRNPSASFDTGPGSSEGQGSGSPRSSATAAAFARKFGRSLNSQLTMRQFSYEELQLATNNFSISNIVSTEGKLKTYSGVLPSGTYVAVKELEAAAGESQDAFAAAVEVFSLVRCPQLVAVLGFACGQGGSRLLVYDLMPNGSLDLHLHELDGNSPTLDWNTRMSIALQVAKALGYLHSMSPQMVHQHLQASTVLMDDHYSCKLSDYCLDSLRQKQGAGPHAASASTNVAVAAGTAAPELAWSSQPTPRTDVYAFGVLLLEIITGRRPIDGSRPPTEQSLVRWTKPRLSERAQVEAMVDPSLRGLYSTSSLYQVALLASQCISTDPESRPSMAQAIDVLQNMQGAPMS